MTAELLDEQGNGELVAGPLPSLKAAALGGGQARAMASTLGCLSLGLHAHSLPHSWASFPSRLPRSLLVDLILYQAVLT